MRQEQINAAEGNIVAINTSIDKKESSVECFDPLQTEFLKESTSFATSSGFTLPTTSNSSAHPLVPPNTNATQTTEQLRLRKKSHNILNRSDSTGSTSGRKFLAPTLSDPQTVRSDKYSQKKKMGSFIGGQNTTNADVSTSTASNGGGGCGSRSQILHSNSNCGLSTIANSGTNLTILSTPNAISTASIPKHTLPPLSNDPNQLQHHNLYYHNTTPQSLYGFDTLSSGNVAGPGTAFDNNNTCQINRSAINNIHVNHSNNNILTNTNLNQICAGSSSTGSNIAGSNSKVNSTTTGANTNHTNVVFEVHDWWSDQVTVQQSSDDDVNSEDDE